ncbi:hypothetical protein PAXRUDRAFT_830127 [Paxillus rubicundulus Ve08.2h10]|uniref:Uncharacterized protein n=1 Tax=Paxillus rubicundulus Ve08.2h10 TaxID=930991 RepID=A0A0D0DLN7_9AGAM|nr:hypothetical protein PAXRUDRAFT_830127 [Paxillus rubicundulus Ve08.2h10]
MQTSRGTDACTWGDCRFALSLLTSSDATCSLYWNGLWRSLIRSKAKLEDMLIAVDDDELNMATVTMGHIRATARNGRCES